MCLVNDPPPFGPVYGLYEKDQPNTKWPSPTGWCQRFLFSTEERRTLYLVSKGIDAGLVGLSNKTPRTEHNNGKAISDNGQWMIEDVHLDWPLYCH
jgi:hypothetical protein